MHKQMDYKYCRNRRENVRRIQPSAAVLPRDESFHIHECFGKRLRPEENKTQEYNADREQMRADRPRNLHRAVFLPRLERIVGGPELVDDQRQTVDEKPRGEDSLDGLRASVHEIGRAHV